jgi:hypothetical protein
MPPDISNDEKDVAAATEPVPDNDIEEKLTECTIRRGADLVLESTFGDQSKAGDFLTDTIVHRRQQKSSLEGSQHQQETAMKENQADTYTIVSDKT